MQPVHANKQCYYQKMRIPLPDQSDHMMRITVDTCVERKTTTAELMNCKFAWRNII